jgi:hypothetical protein
MKFVAVIALFGAVCFAEETRKPVCNATNRGKFWPQEANFNRAAARQLYQSGELEMCSPGLWRYKWQHLRVNVRDLVRREHTPKQASQKADPHGPRYHEISKQWPNDQFAIST